MNRIFALFLTALAVLLTLVTQAQPVMDQPETQVFQCFRSITTAAGGDPVTEWTAFEDKLVEANYLHGHTGANFHSAWKNWLQGDGLEVPVEYHTPALDRINPSEWEGCLIRQCRYADVVESESLIALICQYTDTLRKTRPSYDEATEGWLRIVTSSELEKSVYRWYLLGKWYHSANRLRLAMSFPTPEGSRAPDLVIGFAPGDAFVMDRAYVKPENVTAKIVALKKSMPAEGAGFTVGLIVNEFTTEEMLVQLKAAFDAAGGAKVVYAK